MKLRHHYFFAITVFAVPFCAAMESGDDSDDIQTRCASDDEEMVEISTRSSRSAYHQHDSAEAGIDSPRLTAHGRRPSHVMAITGTGDSPDDLQPEATTPVMTPIDDGQPFRPAPHRRSSSAPGIGSPPRPTHAPHPSYATQTSLDDTLSASLTACAVFTIRTTDSASPVVLPASPVHIAQPLSIPTPALASRSPSPAPVAVAVEAQSATPVHPATPFVTPGVAAAHAQAIHDRIVLPQHSDDQKFTERSLTQRASAPQSSIPAPRSVFSMLDTPSPDPIRAVKNPTLTSRLLRWCFCCTACCGGDTKSDKSTTASKQK